MSSKEQNKFDSLLVIEPQYELKFRGPFNKSVTTNMRLSNPTDQTVLFKIKTTAPKRYCVRPNSGELEPNTSVEVTICLQPFVFDPNEKSKHKFMVQCLVAPPGETNIEKVWKEVDASKLTDYKLRCVFEIPVGNADTETVKQDVKAGGESKLESSEDDHDNKEMAIAITEMRQLREDLSHLRRENYQLKEQVLRLNTITETKKETAYPNTYSPPPLPQQNQMMYIIAGIVMAIFGIILGKFIL